MGSKYPPKDPFMVAARAMAMALLVSFFILLMTGVGWVVRWLIVNWPT